VSCADQTVDLGSRPSHCPNYEWVDPRVLDVPSCFRDSFILDGFLSIVSILKPDVVEPIVITIPTGSVIVGRMVLKTSSLYIHVILMICTLLFFFMSLQCGSLGSSMSLLPSCIQTYGQLFWPLSLFVMPLGWGHPLNPFCFIIIFDRLTLWVGYP